MSTKWTGFFKIVTPKNETETMYDNQDLSGSGLYGNYSWYAKFLNGSSNRLQRYNEYELMDQDVEISLALDTIAEHMSENNDKTDLPFDLDMQVEEGQSVPNRIVMVLRTALRHWSSIHNWGNKIFGISRALCLYGDVFFEKKNDFNKWNYINANKIIGAVVERSNPRNVLGWQVKPDADNENVPNNSYNNQENKNIGILSNDNIVRFTLNDDMTDAAPFGESILRPVFRSHRQKMMLEDAILIYRVVRAPERRVYYIDVGKTPQHKVKRLLTQYKDEIRQKKIPTVQGGKDSMDSVYNVQSMSEDMFFASREGGKGSRVETLPGGANLGDLADLEYFQNKVWRGLRVPLNWMKPSSDSMFNDDRVGTAYIEEIRFTKFIARLQGHIEEVIDAEFKKYLKKCNILIDDTIYKIRLPKPTNFGSFRQQQMDGELLNTITTATTIDYLSKRYVLQRYGQLTDDELLTNERLKMQELGLNPDDPPEDYLTQIYSSTPGGDIGGDMGLGGLDTNIGGDGSLTPQEPEGMVSKNTKPPENLQTPKTKI